MKARVRLAVAAALATIVVASAGMACSNRESQGTQSDETSAITNERVVAVGPGESTPQRYVDPIRGACRPAGALGAANRTSPGTFLAAFAAATSEPLGVCGASEWDVHIHSRAPATWYSLDDMSAQHGPDCAGPPATHALHGDHGAAVFLCRDHLMTALNADDYGVIYLTPNQLVDLSKGPAVVRFDVSTERMSKRDWIDLWLTPWEGNLALPLEGSDPDLQGPPSNSIQVTTTAGENSPVLRTTRANVPRDYKPGYAVDPLGAGVAPGTNESATRQAFQLTVTANSARFERLASPTAPALVYWEERIDFPFEAAVLQLGHHSYTPTKDNSGVPATWHWDNVSISHAIPFNMLRSIERYADEKDGVISFEAPAPKDASLRFSAIGTPELSFDGGKTWSVARRQDGLGQTEGEHHPEHFSSFWTPIPEGTAQVSVRFKADDWYEGPYFAQGFAIWSR
jgi:hypothetical protein